LEAIVGIFIEKASRFEKLMPSFTSAPKVQEKVLLTFIEMKVLIKFQHRGAFTYIKKARGQ
jgi:hypothetical protein